MKVYIISDTHFNHDAIISYCDRPTDHEIKLWKSMEKIGADDLLIHLGDICIGEDQMVHAYIKDLKCRKVLVMGNHDSKSWHWYMGHGWDFACESFKLRYANKTICFSHKPQPWDGEWDINVHGHLHNLGHRDNEYRELKKWHRLYSPELMGYAPIELSKFIQTEQK